MIDKFKSSKYRRYVLGKFIAQKF